MTDTLTTPDTTPDRPTVVRAVAVAVFAGLVAGVVLGVLDLAAQHVLPYPWADLANSPAVWGLAAFALALAFRGEAPAMLAAVVMQVVAVAVYYVVASFVFGDDLAIAVSDGARFWYVGAVGIGALAGLAGVWCRSAIVLQAVLGAAFAPALAWAEAYGQYAAAADRAGWNSNTSATLLLGVIGAAVAVATMSIVLRRHGVAALATSVGTALVLTAFGHAAYLAVGLRGFGA